MEDTKQMQENTGSFSGGAGQKQEEEKESTGGHVLWDHGPAASGPLFCLPQHRSLKVSLSENAPGMLGEVSENAATVFDLRFPRIFISMLARSRHSPCPELLFQAVLKNPWRIRGSSAFPAGQALRRW